MTTKVKIQINDNIKVKGDGQECPSHTGKINIKIKSPRVRDENTLTGLC